jgi:hypothetical protein
MMNKFYLVELDISDAEIRAAAWMLSSSPTSNAMTERAFRVVMSHMLTAETFRCSLESSPVSAGLLTGVPDAKEQRKARERELKRQALGKRGSRWA